MKFAIPFISSLASPKWRLENLYKIKGKDKKSAYLHLNELQIDVLREIEKLKKKNIPVRIIVLKPRQVGCTTFFGVYFFDQIYWNKNQFAAIIAHLGEKAREIFSEIIKHAYDSLPDDIRFRAYNDSVNQLGWRQTGSQFKVTSDGHGITPNRLHLTEVARMHNAKEMIGEALQSVPGSGEVVIESTAAGRGGFFYDACQDAQNNPDSVWRFIFLKWWRLSEYSKKVPENFVLTEKEEALLEKYGDDGLTIENIAFRRWKINEMLANKVDEETGLSGEMLFRQNYPMNPDEAFISSALSIFNVEILEWMRDKANPPVDTTQWGNGWFKAYDGAEIGKEYIISCDPSYGQSRDYTSIMIMERAGGRLVATLRGKYRPYDAAGYLDKLGRFYNNALVAVERNTGHAILEHMMYTFDYPMIYYNFEYDDKGRKVRKPGFYTSEKTRGLILSALEKTISNRETMIQDRQLIEELLNFGYVNGKSQAVHGNDDCVLSYAIGNYLCNQPSMALTPPGHIAKPVGM